MYEHTHTQSEQELGKVDALGGPYQKHATAETGKVFLANQARNTSVKMAGLGDLTSVKMAVRSPI